MLVACEGSYAGLTIPGAHSAQYTNNRSTYFPAPRYLECRAVPLFVLPPPSAAPFHGQCVRPCTYPETGMGLGAVQRATLQGIVSLTHRWHPNCVLHPNPRDTVLAIHTPAGPVP